MNHFKKILTVSLILIPYFSIFSGCGKSLSIEKTAIILKNTDILRGKHCESSAILNCLHYLGYNVNEAMIAGGGSAPDFSFQNMPFPFLGTRNNSMRETFFEGSGIKYNTRIPENPVQSWNHIISLLKDEYPVMLRVDMRYLPYLWNGKYGSKYTSFGWHVITLFAIDTIKGTAWVSDTEKSKLQQIMLKDLEKARFSKTKTFPPKGEYYWVEKKPGNFIIDWDHLFKNSVAQMIKQYETDIFTGKNTFPDKLKFDGRKEIYRGIYGLKLLPDLIKNIRNNPKQKFIQNKIFETFYGYIENYGTGGAGFRIFYSKFLLDYRNQLDREKTENKNLMAGLDILISLSEDSIVQWHQLADCFFKIAQYDRKGENKVNFDNLFADTIKTARNLYEAEMKFYKSLKLLSGNL